MKERVMTESKRCHDLRIASALLGSVLLLSACSGEDGKVPTSKPSKSSQPKAGQTATKGTSEARIAITPKNGATNASINDAKVTVADGKLTEVVMTSAEGDAVKGEIAA
ncbi:hypothetical protein AB0O84_34545, partial [Streptomyces sp. NPDC088752]